MKHGDIAADLLAMADSEGYWADMSERQLLHVQQLNLSAVAHALLALAETDVKESK